MTDADFLCLLGEAEGDFSWAPRWLDEKKERRIVCIDAPPCIDHRQVVCHRIETPLQIEPLAKQLAWDAVFLKLEILGDKSEIHHRFRKALERAHLAVNLLLSDAADSGCKIARHAYGQRGRSVRNGLELASAFPNVPALIVGAGPSLEKNGHLLQSIQDSALILAGGSALNVIGVEPHFAGAIDSEEKIKDFKRYPFSETPFCFQRRIPPEHLALIHGEAILFPDSHFSFLDEWPPFEGGWTVGTFLTSLATWMGCNPIVFVGMDYCYQEGRKYAGKGEGSPSHLIEAVAADGKRFLTQPDWLMARDWLKEWAVRHPAIRFYNATEGGLGFAEPIEEKRLKDLLFAKQPKLKARVHEAVQRLSYALPIEWGAWEKSLKRCADIAQNALFGGGEDFGDERAYRALLAPLWQIWSPVFSRAVAFDPHPEKIRINRLLFFQKVIEEHLQVIEGA